MIPTPTASESSQVLPAGDGHAAIRRRSLRVNLLYAIGGTGFQQICRGLVVILLTKFTSKEILGHYTNSLAVGAPLYMFAMLSLRTVHIGDTANMVPYGNYYAARLLMMIFTFVSFIPIVWWEYVQRPEWLLAALLVASCLSRMVDGMGDICWGLFQKDERMDFVSYSNILRGLAMLIPFALALPLIWLLMHRGAIGSGHALTATVLAAGVNVLLGACVMWFYDRRLARRSRLFTSDWDFPRVQALIVRALPLGVVQLLISLSPNIPRYFLYDQKGGDAALGLFGALTWVIQAVNLVLIQMGHTAANRLAVYFRDDARAFVRLVWKLVGMALAMGAPLFLVCWLLPDPVRWLLRLIYTQEYANQYAEFLIIAGAQCIIFIGSVLGFAVTQMQIYWGQVFIWGLMCLTSYVCSATLIPANPLRGAALTMLATAGVQCVCYVVWVIIGVVNREKLLARIEVRDARAAG